MVQEGVTSEDREVDRVSGTVSTPTKRPDRDNTEKGP